MENFIYSAIILIKYAWKFMFNPKEANKWLHWAEGEKAKMLSKPQDQRDV